MVGFVPDGVSPADSRSRIQRVLPWLTIGAVGFCALAVRLPFVLAADFPLGDGGMFAQIIDDIRAHGFVLPAFTSFNGGSIPLCYPPLGFYLAALSGLPTLTSLLWLPLVLSALVPCAVVLLVRLLARSEAQAFAAGLAAALLPVPYWFGLEGGGLTRSLALLLMVLSAAALLWVIECPSTTRAVLTGAVLASSALSHPEGALMTVIVAGTLLLVERHRVGLRLLATVLGSAALLLLPWLALVLWRHGLGPWLAAFRSSEGSGDITLAVQKITSWWFTAETGLPLLAVLALLGLPIAFLRGQWLPVVALLAPVFLVARNSRFWASPGLAILAGLAVGALIWPGLDRAARRGQTGLLAKTAVLLVITAHGLLMAQSWKGRMSLLAPLATEDREALAWCAERVGSAQQVAAIGSDSSWFDNFAEWAPYLAHVENVVVPQGREWLGDSGPCTKRADALQKALVTDSRAVEEWLQREPTVRWMILGSSKASDVRVQRTLADAASSGVLRLVYQRGGATVWRANSARTAEGGSPRL
jgi:hypothetical protein